MLEPSCPAANLQQLRHVSTAQEFLRTKQPLFTAEQLGELTDVASQTAREASGLERVSKAYWTAVHFAREHAANPHRTWPALMLRWQRVVSSPPASGLKSSLHLAVATARMFARGNATILHWA